jgi:hypothetical protein
MRYCLVMSTHTPATIIDRDVRGTFTARLGETLTQRALDKTSIAQTVHLADGLVLTAGAKDVVRTVADFGTAPETEGCRLTVHACYDAVTRTRAPYLVRNTNGNSVVTREVAA